MIHSGQPAKEFIDSATRHVLLRQGVLGIKVKMYVFFHGRIDVFSLYATA